MARSLLSQLFSPKQRRHHMATCRRAPAVFLERLGCDQLEARLVLDGDSLPSPVPAETQVLPGNTLTLGDEFTVIAHAQFGDFTYNASSDRVTITGYTGPGGEVVIPAEIEGLAVTSIGELAFGFRGSVTSIAIPPSVTDIGRSAFNNCIGLTGVTIPEGVTSIGINTFYNCRSLTHVEIPRSVASIGSGAFHGCTGLTNVTIPSSVTSIGADAFRGCTGLTGVMIPEGVTSIGHFAFSGCSRLTSVTIPTSVSAIGPHAFGDCTGLTSVTIPSSVTSIESGTFYNCIRLSSLTIPNSVISIGTGAFGGCIGLTSVAIPNSVTSIKSSAFRYCSGLISVTIPESVTSIGDFAFSGCTGLTSVTIPSSVTSIGDRAFSSCHSLAAFDVEPANLAFSAFEGILLNKSGTLLAAFPGGRAGGYMIPSSVTRIGGGAFSGGIGLTSVAIPSSVTSIGSWAFAGCTRLTSVTIPDSVTSIEDYAFNYCTGLMGVYCLGNTPNTNGAFVFRFTLESLTVFHLQNTTGWAATFADRPTAIFQPIEVPEGQTVTASIAANVDRVVKQGPGTLVLDAASSHTGGTMIEAGEVIVRNPGSLGSGLLEIQGTAKVAIQSDHGSLALTSLKMATTASLDLGTNRLEIAAGGFNLQQVRGMLVAGRNGGNWDGVAGVASSAAGTGSNRTIGYRVTDGTLEIAFAAAGDTNLDGSIGVQDLVAITAGGKFNTGEAAGWDQGDVNYDGVVNALDLVGMVSTGLYGKGTYIPVIQPAFADVDLSAGEVSVDGPTNEQSDASEIAPLDARLLFTALAIENEAVAGTTAGKKRLG